MDRRDEETRVWPRADTHPPSGGGGPREAPLSFWARLWNFVTVEVPDDDGDGEVEDGPEPESPRSSARRVRVPRGRASIPAGDAPGSGPPAAETALPEVSAWQRTAPPHRQLSSRTLRHGRIESTRARHVRRRRWATGAVALGVAAAALLATHAGLPHPRATVAGAARPAPHAPVHTGRTAPSPAPPAHAPARNAAAGSAPDCASMRMQPVAPAGSSTSPSVPGLCFSLGGGSGWQIGCAPGFQTACDPVLQAVITCVRQDGARQHGAVTTADVRACDAASADASRSAGAGPPTGRALTG